MKIVQITPGSGDNFYCENCLRDIELVKATRRLGHDVLMVPLYLPVQTRDPQPVANAPVFFGGLNVYLQQKLAIFRKTPRWVDRFFDSPKLLKHTGRYAGMTSAKDLGKTTVSMLEGRHGRQTKELDRLVLWLTQQHKPDIVCLSNALLLGLARQIRQALNVPVVCFLQDEDGFLDGLPDPYAKQAWAIVADRAKHVDAFIAVSQYYADKMKECLGLSADRVHLAYTGLCFDGYDPPTQKPEKPTIGFLSRMCPEKGLDTLAEAFIALKARPGLQHSRLRIAGGSNSGDKPFIQKLRRRFERLGLTPDVEFLCDFQHDAKIEFLKTLSVLSVPEKKPVACGLYVLEALAMAVPVVQPDFGVFPELIRLTSGGFTCKPNDPHDLTESLARLLADPDNARSLGTAARKIVLEKFNVNQTAQTMVEIYQNVR